MLLMSVFGFAALFLAAIGVYGLMTYAVQQRTQEIGIRMAPGAQADSVLKMVIRQGMLFSLAGVVGTASAYGLARSIAPFLFGVEPRDPCAARDANESGYGAAVRVASGLKCRSW